MAKIIEMLKGIKRSGDVPQGICYETLLKGILQYTAENDAYNWTKLKDMKEWKLIGDYMEKLSPNPGNYPWNHKNLYSRLHSFFDKEPVVGPGATKKGAGCEYANIIKAFFVKLFGKVIY